MQRLLGSLLWTRRSAIGQCIRHLRISHNALYLPPKILHSLCFSFLLGITAVPREIKSNAYAKFLGANKVHHGGCKSGLFLCPQEQLLISNVVNDDLSYFCCRHVTVNKVLLYVLNFIVKKYIIFTFFYHFSCVINY